MLSPNYPQVIIVEDDLEFSPDFFEYFEATLPLLRSDPSLWCVSAWCQCYKTFFLPCLTLRQNKTVCLYLASFFFWLVGHFQVRCFTQKGCGLTYKVDEPEKTRQE